MTFKLGNLEMSIGTDAIFDKEDVEQIKNSTLYVNIRTLVRNALGAYEDRKNPLGAMPFIRDRVESDIMLLRYHMETVHATNVVIYHVPYELWHHSSLVKLVEPNTEKQKVAAKAQNDAVDLVKDLAEIVFQKGFRNNDPVNVQDAYVMTHYPVDLLDYTSFRSLKLLESHTGAIKAPRQFNTKLKNIPKEHMQYIPMCKATLIIFGDNVLYAKGSDELRDTIINIARKSNWTPATTQSRILFSIQQTDRPLYDAVKSFIK